MKPSEIFDTLVNRVCEEFEIRYESVLNDAKIQTVVEARILCVYFLRKIGFSNDDIALVVLRKQRGDMNYYPTMEEIKQKAKSVDKMWKAYWDKHDNLTCWKFNLVEKDIRIFCRQKYNELYLSGMKELSN